MKKHNIIALIGVLALTANLLIPGLAFGQIQTGPQVGTLGLEGNCSIQPSFTAGLVPTDFSFSSNGTGDPIHSKSVAHWAFKNATSISNYIGVTDVREPSEPICNDGLTLTVEAEDHDLDGLIFGNADGSAYLPLNLLYVATNAQTADCPTGYSLEGGLNQYTCMHNSEKYCGQGDNTPVGLCVDDSIASVNTNATNFAVDTIFTALTDNNLGTAENTISSPIVLLEFADESELFGKAALGVTYAQQIPPGAKSDTYTVNLLYTLTGYGA